MRVAVAGRLAAAPQQGGAAWAVLQYVLGLRRLGHDVLLLEPLPAATPGAAEAFARIVDEFALREHAVLLRPDDESRRSARGALAGTDVLLNLSGVLRDEELLAVPARRVYVDLDPGFTQAWHTLGVDVGLAGHDAHVTVGRSLGRPSCPVPDLGLAWIPSFPPVVLEHWPVGGAVERDAFTSVGNWRSYGSLEVDGLRYGQRAHSLRRLADLPTRTAARIELALAIHPDEGDDLELLRRNRWQLADPVAAAGTPAAYRRFVAGSRAELGVAKAGYVDSRCGWFSDRSACYLASGRPVVAQDTGFGDHLPVGAGLLSFATVEEAAAGIDAVLGDYARHARAARALAEEYLDSDAVLARLLEEVGA